MVLLTNTLISPDNVVVMMAIITGIAAISIVLEQRYQWASRVSGAIIALLIAMVLSNLRVIPIGSVAEDVIWTYVVPLAIPMLLFKANIFKIWKESGKMLILFCISSIGTFLGGIIALFVLGGALQSNELISGQVDAVVAMMTGSYIGGGVNFAAMSEAFNATGDVVAASVVADNLLMVFYFFILISMTSIPLMRKLFKTPYIDEVEKNGIGKEGETVAKAFWGRKEISLKDIALVFAIAFAIFAVSEQLSILITENLHSNNSFINVLIGLISNKYLLLTTFTLLLASFLPKQFDDIRGSQEIGTFLIYTFFVVIGIPASISEIVKNAPILLLFSVIMIVVNVLVTFISAKLLKYTLEEAIIASNANIGGPTTAAAMAISKGWAQLVPVALLIGVFGYVIGNYAGLIIGAIANNMGL